MARSFTKIELRLILCIAKQEVITRTELRRRNTTVSTNELDEAIAYLDKIGYIETRTLIVPSSKKPVTDYRPSQKGQKWVAYYEENNRSVRLK